MKKATYLVYLPAIDKPLYLHICPVSQIYSSIRELEIAVISMSSNQLLFEGRINSTNPLVLPAPKTVIDDAVAVTFYTDFSANKLNEFLVFIKSDDDSIFLEGKKFIRNPENFAYTRLTENDVFALLFANGDKSVKVVINGVTEEKKSASPCLRIMDPWDYVFVECINRYVYPFVF